MDLLLEKHLQDGGAALVVMADEDEVKPTKSELSGLGGTVEDYQVPEETMDKVDQATDVEPATEGAGEEASSDEESKE